VLVRLPGLEPGQNFIWQRSYLARAAATPAPRARRALDQTALAPLPENEAALTVQPGPSRSRLQLLGAPTVAQASIPTLVVVRVRNLGPAVATDVKVAVTVPLDALTLGLLRSARARVRFPCAERVF